MKPIRLVLVTFISFVTFAFLTTSVHGQAPESWLLFTRHDDQTEVTSVYVWNADTGKERLIAETESFYRAGWSPDGRVWVVDQVTWDKDEGRFRFIDAETGAASVLSERLILNLNQCYPALLWSPDGQALAYATATEDARILNIHREMNQTPFTLPFAEGDYLSDWSGDGAYIHIHAAGGKDRLLSAADGREIVAAEDIQFSPEGHGVGYQGNEEIGLDLGYPTRFAAWTAVENQVLLYADFERGEAQTLLRYDLASGETETIFETTGSIWSVSPYGAWWLFRYSPEVGDNAHARILLRNRETGVEFEVEAYYDRYLPGNFVALSPDGRWLCVNADDGVYLFDLGGTNSAPRRLASSTSLNYAVSTSWSADSRYLAFNAEGQLHLLNIDDGTMATLPGTIHELIGWQSAGQSAVMLCGGGGDGNA